MTRKKARRLLLLLLIMVIIVLMILIIKLQIEPTFFALCDSKATYIATKATGDAIYKRMDEFQYEDLMILQKDTAGYITAVNANVIEMNKLSSDISTDIQNEMNNIEEEYLKVPLGNFFGMDILSGFGPVITLKIFFVGNVYTTFKTEFDSTGINQTRHRIILEVKSRVRVVAPFMAKATELNVEVPVSETVIVGEVPDNFYNLEGISSDDTLNMI